MQNLAHKFIVDAHILVWYLEGKKRLSEKVQEIMDAADSQMVLPLIALAEVVHIVERGRTNIPTDSDLLTDVYSDKRIEIYPLTMEVFKRSLTPEGQKIPEMHDRFIVSTGLHLQDLGYSVSILTKNGDITRAGVLPVVW